MEAINTARDRAEEWIAVLQKRARDFLEAEQGLVGNIRDLIEKQGLAPAEVRKRLEEMLGRIKANNVWSRLRDSDAVVALSDYRDGVERRAEESLQKLLEGLQIVTRTDLDEIDRQLKAMNRKITAISKKLKEEG